MAKSNLFRGYSQKGRWVYGSLLNIGQRCVIASQPPTGASPVYCDVVPESVGQAVGANDADGTPIYEGDILAWGEINRHGNLRCDINRANPPYAVKYVDGCFATANVHGYVRYGHLYTAFTSRHYRVIGNLFENPEFMEGYGEPTEYRPFSLMD